MSDQQSSYRQIMKATSLFGGVQFFDIIIRVVRSKFIAVLLGPTGMGIAGLLISTTELIGSFTNFGLGTSAVKDIAAANETGDTRRIAIIVAVFRRLVWYTGLLGTIATLVLSPWFSRLTFGNSDYTLAFVWISVTLLFKQLASGHLVLLQGMRKLKYLANANLTGSLLGLFISVPIYYVWGIDGIVPTIILTAIASLLRAWYFGRKVNVERIFVTRNTTLTEGKDMLKMGLLISLSGIITMASSYLIRIYISNTGGVEDVGLYSAGFTIIGTYVGLVLTAMGKDYYPRLSGVAHDNQKAKVLINQQTEIAILILAPIINIFLVFIQWVVILLYSTKFVAIDGMIHWAALGMFFRAISWSIGFLFLAKGASKIFFWNELTANTYILALNILGYRVWGLDGLGISFMVGYIIYFIQVFFITKFKFQFALDKAFIKIMGIQLTNSMACFIVVKTTHSPISYILGSLLILASCWYSLFVLNRKIDIRSILRSVLKK